MTDFKIHTNYEPTGDQPAAIEDLVDNLESGKDWQTLLGVTGSGKTFTMANVIDRVNRPTLVISHNKTLAAQLYSEFKNFFPENAVEYFISFFDYYQPEAYLPVTDTFIEKDSSINEEIDKLRLRATSALMSRRDVIVVASVSCIYGIGSPADYSNMSVQLEKNQKIGVRSVFAQLVDIHYTRSNQSISQGQFRGRGDVVDIFPAYEEHPYRLEFWGNEIENIYQYDHLQGKKINELESITIFPAKHFITTDEAANKALKTIRDELDERLAELRSMGKELEAQRLEQRTNYDLEMIQEVGYCSGIENYSRHFSGRKPGEPPFTLFDFFPDDYLLMIDESHVTVPQLRAMYNGDRARKETLVEHGFRLPSALDHRPLKFEEFEERANQTIFVSATPSDYELDKCDGVVTEQIIRPTGLLEPQTEVKPTKNQIDDLIDEIERVTNRNERVLITTLTKKMAEDLTDYLDDMGIRVRYLHSEIDTLERVEILRDLRLGEFDVLVGINLLREGLDLPEVSLVAILDADKEGFLRSETALMQVAGRAARNLNGKVIFYADEITGSMRRVIDEVERRREIQKEYNEEHDITPKSIYKSADEIKAGTKVADVSLHKLKKQVDEDEEPVLGDLDALEEEEMVDILKKEMTRAAEQLQFEKAAELRDKIKELTGKEKIKDQV
ncbi:MAG: excinuclease ABC subunit UvrB [Candidatus Marinimicrobia bacterium]|nr:excinuclease ABC subunit UvrB [Candidatus Neomarinimicrobiota bacterium]